MIFPSLNVQQSSKQTIDAFLGYNHNLRIGDGEFYDMKNLTSSYYPLLSPREKRGVFAKPEAVQGMIAKDALCYVDGTDFVMNEYRVDLGLSTDEKDCPKQLVSMGAYVVIFPDKKYINTADLTDFGNLGAEFVSSSKARLTLCRIDAEEYSVTRIDSTAPAEPKNMELWIDTSSTPHVLKQYSSVTSVWTTVPTTYIKISTPGIDAAFEVNDGIEISGIEGEGAPDINGSAIVWGKGDGYIVVVGIIDTVFEQETPITVKRKIPDMDFVIESSNRLWGCRYGLNSEGKVVNEIYASKLGDFKNFNCFMGISTDSYAASVGTDGQFTGAITHLGYPLFFKENYLHKVYGSIPANFQIQTVTCRGVQKGSENSLAIVNEVLYYKSKNGVCVYDGSLPSEISEVFGEELYDQASSGGHGNKYYISMRNQKSGLWEFYVFDASKGIWHKEDDVQAKEFCSCRNELYFIDAADGKIKTVFGGGEEKEKRISWMAQSGAVGLFSPDRKYVSGLNVRISLDVGTTVRIFAQYDSAGSWEQLCSLTGTGTKLFTVFLRPRRCDHFRLRIEGYGEAKIYSITKTLTLGSDI